MGESDKNQDEIKENPAGPEDKGQARDGRLVAAGACADYNEIISVCHNLIPFMVDF